MIKSRVYTCILVFIFFAILQSIGQNTDIRVKEIALRLDVLQQQGVPLNQKVTIALDGSVQEMVALLAAITKLNLAVETDIQSNVSNSFTNAPARDIILYLCDNNQLDLRFTGEIIRFIKYKVPTVEKEIATKKLDISVDTSGFVTMNLREDTLENVLKTLSQLTHQHIVATQTIRANKVNGFINKAKFETAIEQLAEANDLRVEGMSDYYLLKEGYKTKLSPISSSPTVNYTNSNTGGLTQNSLPSSLSVSRSGEGKINIQAINISILEILKQAATETRTDYYLLPDMGYGFGENNLNSINGVNNQYNNRPLNTGAYNQQSGGTGSFGGDVGTVSMQLKSASFKEILDYLCKNSDYNYSEQAGLFIVGKKMAEGLRTTRIIPMRYRSVKGIIKHIPQQMTIGVSIDTLFEENSLVLTGASRNIAEIDSFLKSIDKIIPVIMIEMIIVNVKTSKISNLGIEAGTTPGGAVPGGAVSSTTGTNFSFSSGAINRLLRFLAGSNSTQLGQVSPDFYLTLKAVEQSGYVDVKSTPRLTTLNSHNATLSIGQKRYYQEQQVNFQGNDRPVSIQALVYKAVEANLHIDVTPILSQDDQITLDIKFEQTDFLDQVLPNAPPASVSRKFESITRVKNGEMIVLGGLETSSKSTTKSGIPLLSKIPLIGWIFGSHQKNNSKEKLLVFVKPVIIN